MYTNTYSTTPISLFLKINVQWCSFSYLGLALKCSNLSLPTTTTTTSTRVSKNTAIWNFPSSFHYCYYTCVSCRFFLFSLYTNTSLRTCVEIFRELWTVGFSRFEYSQISGCSPRLWLLYSDYYMETDYLTSETVTSDRWKVRCLLWCLTTPNH